MSTFEATVFRSGFITGTDKTKALNLANLFNPISEREFMESIDKSIRQADMGDYQEADEAIDDISTELKI